ncbi:thermonuclease family protein [Bacillus timonensis]|nr:thermonuclease family protein [Bacillus timonensis]
MKIVKYMIQICLLIVLCSCASTSIEESNSENTVPVIKIIDGDTIKVDLNGKEESVRFLLIDTPETNHPRMNGPQPFGLEAKKFTANFFSKGKAELELDVSERDKYGRILAYVYVDGVSIQEALLKEGLARVAYIYPPNTRYVEKYQQLQKEAQKLGIGIWSIENYASEEGFNSNNKESLNSAKNQSCHIKGNINSKGEKIYHVPSGLYYERTKEEECFQTEADAIEAGYRKSKR